MIGRPSMLLLRRLCPADNLGPYFNRDRIAPVVQQSIAHGTCLWMTKGASRVYYSNFEKRWLSWRFWRLMQVLEGNRGRMATSNSKLQWYLWGCGLWNRKLWKLNSVLYIYSLFMVPQRFPWALSVFDWHIFKLELYLPQVPIQSMNNHIQGKKRFTGAPATDCEGLVLI